MSIEILKRVVKSKPIRTALAAVTLLTAGSGEPVTPLKGMEVTSGNGNGLHCNYYNEIYDFSNINPESINPDYQQNVDTIDFDLGYNSPVPGIIDPETFTIRCSAILKPQESGVYRIFGTGDDGIRISINNERFIDQWHHHPVTEYPGKRPFQLTAGSEYKFELEYYDNLWHSVAKVSWQTPTLGKQVIPREVFYSPDIAQTPVTEPGVGQPAPLPDSPTSPDPDSPNFTSSASLAWVTNSWGQDIFIGNASGSYSRVLSPHPQEDKNPTFTSGILYWQTHRYGQWEIVAQNPNDNSIEPKRITNHSSHDEQPNAFGQDIAFISDREGDGIKRVYTAKTYGTEAEVKLLNRLPYHQSDPKIYWDPFDKNLKVAFKVNLPPESGGDEIHIQNLDGTSAPKNVSIRRGNDSQPTPSPDGKWMAHRTDNGSIAIVSLDPVEGFKRRILTQGNNPSWHPGSSEIAFDRNDEIYRIKLDGSGLVQLTTNSAADFQPVFSPDGSMIAYISNIDQSQADIFVMSSGGTNKRNISNNTSTADLNPVWQQ